MQIRTLRELQALSQAPIWPSDFAEVALMIDLSGAPLTDPETDLVNRWLQRLPVPSVGLNPGSASDSLRLDVLVETEAAGYELLERIRLRPKAASVLVQTTRMTLGLPVASGLVIESLGYGMLQAGSEFTDWLQHQPMRASKTPVAEPVHLDRQDSTLNITLAQPENRNALSVAMRDGLTDAFSLVAMDPSIEDVIVRGEGPCFSAGGDLSEFGSCRDVSDAHRIRQLRMSASVLAEASERYTFYLHGACIGAGIELPAFAERIIATPDTVFRLPEVAMGLIPGAGGCVSITKRIGNQRTNWLAISGTELSAEQALAWGLIDAIAD